MDKGRGEEMERKGERNQIIFIALKCSFTLANIPFYFILFCLLVSRFGFLSFVVILPTQWVVLDSLGASLPKSFPHLRSLHRLGA